MKPNRQLERELKPLVEGARREIIAIGARPFEVESVPFTSAAEARASLRAESVARIAEARKVFDRVIYAVRVRYGEKAEKQIAARLNRLFETVSAQFSQQVESICG